MKDLYNELAVINSIPAGTSVTDNTVTNGSAADLSNGNGAMAVINTGTLASASATFAVKLQDSPDGITWTDVDSSLVVGSANFTFSDDNKCFKLGYIGNQQYLRPVITPSGNAAAAAFSASVIVGGRMKQPPA